MKLMMCKCTVCSFNTCLTDIPTQTQTDIDTNTGRHR